MSKEAMQMALDALLLTVEEMRSLNGSAVQQEDAIEALRTALAQPEQKEQWSNGYKAGYAQAQETDLAMPRKEWVGLTEDERKEILQHDRDFWRPLGYENMLAENIEAKLKEKNT